jgi:hypothetical protein
LILAFRETDVKRAAAKSPPVSRTPCGAEDGARSVRDGPTDPIETSA